MQALLEELGLEVQIVPSYIGPGAFGTARNTHLELRGAPFRPRPEPAAGSLQEPVADPRLAEALAALADEYEELNPRGREALLIRFWHAHPDLAERAASRQGRRLARLAGGRGPAA